MKTRNFFAAVIIAAVLCGLIFVMPSASGSRVLDNADVLSDEEESALEKMFASIYDKYGIDAVAMTYDGGLDEYGTQDFADITYEQGYSPDGILYLVCIDGYYAFSTSGTCEESINDHGLAYIDGFCIEHLYGHDWYGAFYEYAVRCAELLEEAADGTPYGAGDYEQSRFGEDDPGYDPWYDDDWNNDGWRYENERSLSETIINPVTVFLTFFIPLIAALIRTKSKESQMNTAKPQYQAEYYIDPSGIDLKVSEDIFLYSNISKVRRSRDDDGSGRGGGSRSSGGHFSSSGAHHGGRSGRF